jgi:hypothetical protein
MKCILIDEVILKFSALFVTRATSTYYCLREKGLQSSFSSHSLDASNTFGNAGSKARNRSNKP